MLALGFDGSQSRALVHTLLQQGDPATSADFETVSMVSFIKPLKRLVKNRRVPVSSRVERTYSNLKVET